MTNLLTMSDEDFIRYRAAQLMAAGPELAALPAISAQPSPALGSPASSTPSPSSHTCQPSAPWLLVPRSRAFECAGCAAVWEADDSAGPHDATPYLTADYRLGLPPRCAPVWRWWDATAPGRMTRCEVVMELSTSLDPAAHEVWCRGGDEPCLIGFHRRPGGGPADPPLSRLATWLESIEVPRRGGHVVVTLASNVADEPRGWLIVGGLAARWSGTGPAPEDVKRDVRAFLARGRPALEALKELRERQEREASAEVSPIRLASPQSLPALVPTADSHELSASEIERFLERLGKAGSVQAEVADAIRFMTIARSGGQMEMLDVSGVVTEPPDGSTWCVTGALAYRWRVREARNPPKALAAILDNLLSDRAYVDAVLEILGRKPASVASRAFKWEEEGWDHQAGEAEPIGPAVPLERTGT